MVCQVCGEKSGFFPICKSCNAKKEKGEVSKCEDCGIWKKGDNPLCPDCYWNKQSKTKKQSRDYKKTESEVEDDSFRNKFVATIITNDGHRVRSRAEKIIDDWLYQQKILHAYERKAPITEDLYCDFYLPEWKVWIEYWGSDEVLYIKRKETKKNLYKKYGYKLIELNDSDIEKIDDIMPAKLRSFLPDDFCFD